MTAPLPVRNETADYTHNRIDSTSTASYVHDNEGQLSTKTEGGSTSYTFDDAYRLTGISDGTATSYSYDGAGNRLRAVRNSTETRYIYDAAGNLLAETDSSNTITRYYIHGAGLLATVTPVDAVYCYHYDGVGSTVAITNSSQGVVNSYTYSPFGMLLNESESFAQPFKYVGKLGVMAEDNGFYYMRARYYDPVIGRFISEDPLGFGGGDVNLFVYGSNNPVLLVDPFGLESHYGSYSKPSSFGNRIVDSVLTDAYDIANDYPNGARADVVIRYLSVVVGAATGGGALNYQAVRNPGVYRATVNALEGALSPTSPSSTTPGVLSTIGTYMGSQINNGPPQSRFYNPQMHDDYRTAP